jgi:hypothetical protein
MASVELGSATLDIHLSLGDELLALHGDFHIPYQHILSVSTAPVPVQWFQGVRIGTNIPGVKTAGTFITGEGVIFYDVHDRSRCLTLELDHERYRRVVVEVDGGLELEALADAISDRIGGGAH